MIKRLRTTNLLLIYFILVVSGNAWAADIGCGRDTDQNGSVDAWCTSLFNCTDDDADGYCTNGLGPNAGIDCNDHDFFDYPDPAAGTDTGCSSGQAKACQSDGTYTACQNFCPSDCLQCYWIDTASGSDAAAGTWAAPWKTSAMFSDSNSHPSGWHSRVAGDCFVYKDSSVFADTVSYSSSETGGGTKVYGFVLNGAAGADGNSTNPIRILGIPGKWPTYTNATSQRQFGVLAGGQAYTKVSGFKITGSNCSGGINNSVCLSTDSSANNDLYNLIGNANTGTDNTGDFMMHSSTDSSVHHFYTLGHTSADGNLNNLTGFLGYRGQNNYVHDFVSIIPGGSANGVESVKVKHSDYSSEWTFERGIVQGGEMEFASRQTILRNILMIDAWPTFRDPGGTAYTGDETMQYLTVVQPDGPVLSFVGYQNYDISGSAASDRCSSDYTMGPITLSDSILQDSDTSYANKDDRMIFIGLNDPDPVYFETLSAFSMTNTLVYNPNTAPSFAIFESSNASVDCSTNAYGVLGGSATLTTLNSTFGVVTTGSSVTNPVLDSQTKAATCGALCAGKGWNGGWGTASSGGGSPASCRKGQKNCSARKGQ